VAGEDLWQARDGYLRELHGFRYFASYVYSTVNIVVATPFVPASVTPSWEYTRIAGH